MQRTSLANLLFHVMDKVAIEELAFDSRCMRTKRQGRLWYVVSKGSSPIASASFQTIVIAQCKHWRDIGNSTTWQMITIMRWKLCQYLHINHLFSFLQQLFCFKALWQYLLSIGIGRDKGDVAVVHDKLLIYACHAWYIYKKLEVQGVRNGAWYGDKKYWTWPTGLYLPSY